MPIDAPDTWQETSRDTPVLHHDYAVPLLLSADRLPVMPESKYKGILSVKEYEKLLSKEYKTRKRSEHRFIQALPDPPHPSNFESNADYEKACVIWIHRMRSENDTALALDTALERVNEQDTGEVATEKI